MLDAVSSAHTLLIALSYLELSYLGVSFGRSSPQKLETGIQITLVAMTLKASMDIRYDKILVFYLNICYRVMRKFPIYMKL